MKCHAKEDCAFDLEANMRKYEKTELTNMCMVYDKDGNILVQDRASNAWGGVTFPGGHIEKGESFVGSVIREIKEETGLDIKNPKICGVKQWYVKRNVRYLVFFYKTNEYSGTLKSSEEGNVFWIRRDELKNYKLASDFEEMYRIFADDNLQEFQWSEENGEFVKHIY